MKTINVMLRKCKTLSKQLSRSTSNTSIGSKSSRHDHDDHHNNKTNREIIWNTNAISAVYVNDENDNGSNEEHQELVLVGSTRKRYVISSKYLIHPLINALIDKSKQNYEDDVSVINCEVVLFDHLLWMLETSDLNVTSDCLDELADLYSS